MELGAGLYLEQRQMLSQNQVQSLNILTMTNQELNDYMTNEFLENPILEHKNSESDDRTNIDTMYEQGESYKDHYMADDEDDSKRQNDIVARSPDELKEDLMMQLQKNKYTGEQLKLMELLVECLDDQGFFPYDAAAAADFLKYPVEMVEECLLDLKDLEPVGIFTKDLSEFLLKQLEVLGVEDKKLIKMVKDYLPDIMNGRIGNVTRSLNLSTVAVRKYMLLLGKLNPRPIMDVRSEETEYIVPDILLRESDSDWEVILNDKWMGEYKYNDYYVHMMKSSKDEELTNYFKERLERASFLLNCVEQRRNTVVRITKAIVELQPDYFFRKGELRPMYLKDVADRIEMHPSTVSRAIKGKYLQYRYGTVMIKELFAASVLDQDGQEGVSTEHIKNQIKALVDQEDWKKPLSDMTLARLLEGQGIQISRRTVAKYRTEMGIMDSHQRRYYE